MRRAGRKCLGERASLDEGKALNEKCGLQGEPLKADSKLTMLDLLTEYQSKVAPRAPSQHAARLHEHKHYISRISAARGLTAGAPTACCWCFSCQPTLLHLHQPLAIAFSFSA